LPPQGIAQVLRDLPQVADPNLLVGTATADDAGVYRLSDDLALVQTVDFFPPLVDDPFVFGQIAAANALSDVYAMGGVPKTALNLVAFPDHRLPLTWLQEILRGGAERCAEAGCVIVGGHSIRDSEIKYGLAVTGLIHPAQVLTNAAAKPGDRLILTKPLGTGFIVTAAKAGRCPKHSLDAAVNSMVTLNRTAAEVMRRHAPHSVTDVTGFGLAGHALEMALASEVTLRIDLKALPLLTGLADLVAKRFFTRASQTNKQFVAEHLKVEGTPDTTAMEAFFDAQTSGGLLISVSPDRADALLKDLQGAGTPAAAVIGSVFPRGSHALIVA
jgi:selenide,water dikinase